MQLTKNFGFLADHDAELVKLGALAERYFRDDPPTALIKLRQFAELLSKLIAAHHALYVGERETFEDTLRRLSYERIVPREAADLFHAIRKYGNAAVHEASGTHAEALSGLRFARQLGIWFHRTYGKKPDFKPGPFVPPPEPVDATAPLRAEIAALQHQLAASSDATAAARREPTNMLALARVSNNGCNARPKSAAFGSGSPRRLKRRSSVSRLDLPLCKPRRNRRRSPIRWRLLFAAKRLPPRSTSTRRKPAR